MNRYTPQLLGLALIVVGGFWIHVMETRELVFLPALLLLAGGLLAYFGDLVAPPSLPDLLAAEDHEGSVLSDERRVVDGGSQNRTQVGQLPARGWGEDDAGVSHACDRLHQPFGNMPLTIDEGSIHVGDNEA